MCIFEHVDNILFRATDDKKLDPWNSICEVEEYLKKSTAFLGCFAFVTMVSALIECVNKENVNWSTKFVCKN